jgi:glutaredoxin-like YruB-family protein
MKKVTIYSTATCMYCVKAKEFFAQNKVPYEEFDVGKDIEKRKEMLELTGQMGVPVIAIEGETEPIIGFDKPRIVNALGL